MNSYHNESCAIEDSIIINEIQLIVCILMIISANRMKEKPLS